MPRRTLALVALLVLSAVVVASCKSGGSPTPPGGTSSGVVDLSLWHSMKSPYSAALQRIVDEFNKSQKTYHVQSVYQGSYTESLNKVIATSGTQNIPALVQLDDAST